MGKTKTLNDSPLLRVDLAELVLWDDNYNQGDIGAIAISIRRFGLNNVPRIWRGLNVRAGNHTVQALRQIQREGQHPIDREWPPQHVYIEGDQWFIDAMDIGDLSPVEASAFAIADNRAAERSSHDEDALRALLLAIHSEDDDLLLATGYDDEDLALLTTPDDVLGGGTDDVFGDFSVAGIGDFVRFTWGDYSAQIKRDVYMQFVERVKAQTQDDGTVLLDDVLEGLLR